MNGGNEQIDWLPWSAEAFRRSAELNRPVFLFMEARWASRCRFMKRTTLRDERVVRLLRDHFISVYVDADERPDLADRFHLGSEPTCAFLSEQAEIIAGGSSFDRPRMVKMLEGMREAWATKREEIDRAVAERDGKISQAETAYRDAPRPELNAEVMRRTLRGVLSDFDEENGGFGREERFPRARSLELLVSVFRETGGFDIGRVLVQALEGLAGRNLYDARGGGFARCALSSDWGDVQTEKPVEENGRLVRIFFDAWLLTGQTPFRAVAETTAGWIAREMLDRHTGFFGLSRDDGIFGEDVDRRVFPAPNVEAAGAFLRSGILLERGDRIDAALRVLEGLDLDRELLSDRAMLALGWIEAYEATGDEYWLGRARKMLQPLLREYRTLDGWLLDRLQRPGDVEGVKKSKRMISANGLAAEALLRFSSITGEVRWKRAGCEVLSSFPDFGLEYGHATVEYAMAMDRAARPEFGIDIYVPGGVGLSHPLAGTALAAYLPRRVVRWHDTNGEAFVVVQHGGSEGVRCDDPEELATLLSEWVY